MRTLLISIVLGLGATAVVFAAPLRLETFDKRVGKYAPDDFDTDKPKGLCVCQNGGAYHNRVGHLSRSIVVDGACGGPCQWVQVTCRVRGFSANGGSANALCNPPWVPLTK
jgi:hypothetical protein